MNVWCLCAWFILNGSLINLEHTNWYEQAKQQSNVIYNCSLHCSKLSNAFNTFTTINSRSLQLNELYFQWIYLHSLQTLPDEVEKYWLFFFLSSHISFHKNVSLKMLRKWYFRVVAKYRYENDKKRWIFICFLWFV